jgi:hypothetical protein
MSAVRSQVGVLPSPRSSSEKKDPGLRVFSGYSCVPIFIHTSSPAQRCQTTCAAPPRDRHVATKLSLALATKAKSQRAESALLCASVVASLGSFFLSIFDSPTFSSRNEDAYSSRSKLSRRVRALAPDHPSPPHRRPFSSALYQTYRRPPRLCPRRHRLEGPVQTPGTAGRLFRGRRL